MACEDRRILIPIMNSSENVVIFPDELPVGDMDYNDLVDVLRSELAPLHVWRACAVSIFFVLECCPRFHFLSLNSMEG
jgi:hypothetical protein